MSVYRPWSPGQVSTPPLLLRDSFDKYNIAVWPFFFLFQHFECIIPPSASLQGFHGKSITHLREASLCVVGGLHFPAIAMLLAFDSGRLDWTCAGFVLRGSLTSKMCTFLCHSSLSLSLCSSVPQSLGLPNLPLSPIWSFLPSSLISSGLLCLQMQSLPVLSSCAFITHALVRQFVSKD